MDADAETAGDEGAWVAGFVAGEGTFTGNTTSSKESFTFAVAVGSSDERSCRRLRWFFGIGNLKSVKRRRDHYEDETIFYVRSLTDLIGVIVPFMDEHLPPSYKRQQYLEWRERLIDYWKNRAKRVRPCTIPGCETRRRAHGLCRPHLYKARGY